LVSAERAIASAVLERASTLAVVTGPSSPERDEIVSGLGGSRPAVLDDAERLDVETFASFFASCTDDETVVLAGDLDELSSAGAGQVFADIAASGGVVRQVVPVSASVLDSLTASIRAGHFVAPDDPSRQVVVLSVASVEEAAFRVEQLMTTSIPRALGIASADVQVLAVMDSDLSVLSRAVSNGGAAPLTVSEAVGHRYEGAVVVLSPASSGVLSRQLIYSAVRLAARHLSIVNATGSALADAVQAAQARRRTLLPRLLAQVSSGSHSRSSSSESSSSDSSSPSTGPNGVTSSNPENSASS
jgi:exodeoxyribonuclease V alpha subunit